MRQIETTRLILRGWKLSDLDDLHAYGKNPNVGPAAGWQPHTNKAVSLGILHNLMSKRESWAISLKSEMRVIGSISITDDPKRSGVCAKIIGYNIAEEYWSRGYATEAARAAIHYAFVVQDAAVVSVSHYPYNSRSKRVIEKCGFSYEGTLRRSFLRYDGQTLDLVCYSMLREEFFKKQEAN